MGATMQTMQERRARMPSAQSRGVATPKKLMTNVNLAAFYQDQQLQAIRELTRKVEALELKLEGNH